MLSIVNFVFSIIIIIVVVGLTSIADTGLDVIYLYLMAPPSSTQQNHLSDSSKSTGKIWRKRCQITVMRIQWWLIINNWPPERQKHWSPLNGVIQFSLVSFTTSRTTCFSARIKYHHNVFLKEHEYWIQDVQNNAVVLLLLRTTLA